MEIISKQEARDRGLTRYFTGKPCSRGHISERFLKGHCVECNRADNLKPAAVEARRRYAQTDKGREVQRRACAKYNATDARKEWTKQWRKANPEKQRDADARYVENSREEKRARGRNYAACNREKRREQLKVWQANNRGRCNEYSRRRKAVERQAAVYTGEKPFISLIYELGRELGLHVDHIIPQTHRSVTGLHTLLNLRLLGPAKNMSKGNKFNPDRAHLVSPY